MELKNDLTIENVYKKLSIEFSHKYSVKIKANPFFRSVKWVEVYKNPFASVRVYLKTNYLQIESRVPSAFVRVIFGLIIFWISQGTRDNMEREILKFLNK